MGKRFFILSVIIMIVVSNISLYGSKTYTYYNSDYSLDVSLILFDSNSFVIQYQHSSGDIMRDSYALGGSYYFKNDTICFHDNMYGLDLLGQISLIQFPTRVEYFKFITNYPFLQNINFERNDYEYSSDELRVFHGFSDHSSKDQNRIDNELKLWSNTKNKFSFKEGKYFANFIIDNKDLCLDLRQDHSFSYYFLDEIVINGTWSRIKNIITLKDALSLNKYLLAVTANNQISAIFLPFLNNEKLEYRTFK